MTLRPAKFLFVIFGCMFQLAESSEVAVAEIVQIVDVLPEPRLGSVTFTKDGDFTTVHASLSGLPTAQSEVAIAIYDYGDSRRRFDPEQPGSTTIQGNHFDPTLTRKHALPGEYPSPSSHHVGDMGNWTVVAGTIDQTKVFSHLDLNGITSIVGRAVVVHAGADRGKAFGSGGNSGARIADGVIGVANVPLNTASSSFAVTGYYGVSAQLVGTSLCQSCRGWVHIFGPFYPNGETRVFGKLYNPNNASRPILGMTISEFGDRSAGDGSKVGGHFNPAGLPHGLPFDSNRHVGDLGNAQNYDESDGSNWVDITVHNLLPYSSLLGRALVIHEHPDDGCAGGETGNVGAAIMVGVIGLRNGGTGLRTVLPPIAIDNSPRAASCAPAAGGATSTAASSGTPAPSGSSSAAGVPTSSDAVLGTIAAQTGADHSTQEPTSSVPDLDSTTVNATEADFDTSSSASSRAVERWLALIAVATLSGSIL